MTAPLVGFTGSRSLSPAAAPLVAGVVGSVVAGGRGVAVGCAAGADALVRAAAPGARVWSVSAFSDLPRPAALAQRSVAMVHAVAASGPGAGLVAFPAAPCPAGLVPARSWRACGSGTWSSAALAAGLGLPVVVFPAGWPWAPPAWPGGSWQPAAAGGVWAQGWRWVPAAQLSLL
ncbi:MAG: hypothetical protein M5U01_09980 [Ardenticatenaceae bacterium]|nr:hypothetical protein [Ardenticatenaceae bacterium]